MLHLFSRVLAVAGTVLLVKQSVFFGIPLFFRLKPSQFLVLSWLCCTILQRGYVLPHTGLVGIFGSLFWSILFFSIAKNLGIVWRQAQSYQVSSANIISDVVDGSAIRVSFSFSSLPDANNLQTLFRAYGTDYSYVLFPTVARESVVHAIVCVIAMKPHSQGLPNIEGASSIKRQGTCRWSCLTAQVLFRLSERFIAACLLHNVAVNDIIIVSFLHTTIVTS